MARPAKRKGTGKTSLWIAGALIAGGVAGGALSILVLGDRWFWNLVFAALGAWLAYMAAERLAARRRKKGRRARSQR